MRLSMRLLGLALVVAPTVLAQRTSASDDDEESSTRETSRTSETSRSETRTTSEARSSENSRTTESARTTDSARTSPSLSDFRVTSAPSTGTPSSSASSTGSVAPPGIFSSPLPTIQGVGIPQVQIPDTAAAAFMQKSSLPDGTVFICVGAVLAFLGAAVLAWRGLVAWSLHRSVKRAAVAQNLADLKAMSAVPGKKRGMYNVVGASSNMSLDHLSAAPTGTSKPPKPFASNPAGTPPKSTSSLFFSPTAGGLRDSVANRSSNYLPAGYYAAGNAQPASGSPVTHVGGHATHLSTHSLATPGNRFSARSGISPPGSPSLPPSRGYDRAPPSRDGTSLYNRNSVATMNATAPRGGVYGQEHGNPSQLSLNVPGGTSASGARAPSAYLEDLFENHGSGPNQRY